MRFVIVFALLGAALAYRPSVVPTTSGLLTGVRAKTAHLGHVHQFLGVPYAQAPVGKLRFAPPRALEEHAAGRRLNATTHGPNCYQPQHIKELLSNLLDHDDTEMSEDCLTLNIYVPETQALERLPVIVLLSGEGFDFAISRHFDGSYLALQGNVIVVTLNYRVSSFGFLSTLTAEAPGNVGLLDQRMALKWVKRNIAHFGGNPEKVTLMGRFTGSMSVSIHLTSPIKEKLFEKAVMQSGIAVGDYVFDSSPLNTTSEVAWAAGCPVNSIPEMVTCLQGIPAEELIRTSFRARKFFRPVFDGELIVEEPLEAVRKGRHQAADVIIGTNQNEGSLCLLTLQYLKSTFYERLLRNKMTLQDITEMVDYHLKDFRKEEDSMVSKLVLHEYRYQHPKEGMRSQYVQFCGDMYIASQAEQMARLLSQNKKGAVYAYEFSHRPSFSVQPEFVGAAHGDDVLFALGLVLKRRDIPKQESLLSKKMALALGNFALDSDPSVMDGQDWDLDWPEYNQHDQHVMHFTTGRPTARRSKLDRATSFWHDIVPMVHSSKARSTVLMPNMHGRVMALTSSKSFVTQTDKLRFLSDSRPAASEPEQNTAQQNAAFVLIAMALCNIVLLVVSAVSIARLCRPQSKYQSLEKL